MNPKKELLWGLWVSMDILTDLSCGFGSPNEAE